LTSFGLNLFAFFLLPFSILSSSFTQLTERVQIHFRQRGRKGQNSSNFHSFWQFWRRKS
jgi:hypothetical protein